MSYTNRKNDSHINHYFTYSVLWMTIVFLIIALAACTDQGTPVDEEQTLTLKGNVTNEYSIYDDNLIAFTKFPIGQPITTFILEVDGRLFEVEPSDFEKYGGGRMVEIQYMNTDFNYVHEIESITDDGEYTKSENQRQVFGILSITGDPHPGFD